VRALTAKVRRVVYLSAAGVPADPDPRAAPDGGILASHAHLEGLIAAAGIGHTFLRASGFATNTLGWAGQLRRSDVLRWIHPDARRALVHEADLAAVGVRALTEDGHAGRAYHLTGPEQLTQAEQLAAIGDAVGRELRFEAVDPADVGPELFPGLRAGVVDGIVAAHAAMATNPEPVTDVVGRLLGRPARPYARWARDHARDFTGPA